MNVDVLPQVSGCREHRLFQVVLAYVKFTLVPILWSPPDRTAWEIPVFSKRIQIILLGEMIVFPYELH